MPTPVPQSDQRSSSRAPSETPSAPAIDADSEDLNLSEMMNRRMKEAKVVKVQLAEEVSITLYAHVCGGIDPLVACHKRQSTVSAFRSSKRF